MQEFKVKRVREITEVFIVKAETEVGAIMKLQSALEMVVDDDYNGYLGNDVEIAEQDTTKELLTIKET